MELCGNRFIAMSIRFSSPEGGDDRGKEQSKFPPLPFQVKLAISEMKGFKDVNHLENGTNFSQDTDMRIKADVYIKWDTAST